MTQQTMADFIREHHELPTARIVGLGRGSFPRISSQYVSWVKSTFLAYQNRPTSEQRFWKKVVRTSRCWYWTGADNGKGYGRLRRSGKRILAHQFAWIIKHGPVPDGMEVCHKCDNTVCVRPDHLFLGTRSDNMKDMGNKGRHWLQHDSSRRRGENNPNAKLGAQQVRSIRRMARRPGGQAEAARKYGMSTGHISRIVARKVWNR